MPADIFPAYLIPYRSTALSCALKLTKSPGCQRIFIKAKTLTKYDLYDNDVPACRKNLMRIVIYL
jgi:hypothetical protein